MTNRTYNYVNHTLVKQKIVSDVRSLRITHYLENGYYPAYIVEVNGYMPIFICGKTVAELSPRPNGDVYYSGLYSRKDTVPSSSIRDAVMKRYGLPLLSELNDTSPIPTDSIGGSMLLMELITYKHIWLIESLLHAGVNINYRYSSGYTALGAAVHYNMYDLISLLARYGADANCAYKDHSLIRYATMCATNPVRMMSTLMGYGADIKEPVKTVIRPNESILSVLVHTLGYKKLSVADIKFITKLVKTVNINDTDVKANSVIDNAKTDQMRDLLLSLGSNPPKVKKSRLDQFERIEFW